MTATAAPSPYCVLENASMYCQTPSGTTLSSWALPCVRYQTWLKTLASQMMESTVIRTKMGRTMGMVTLRKVIAAEAPSTAAASYRSRGTSVRAEYIMRDTKGTAPQTMLATMML